MKKLIFISERENVPNYFWSKDEVYMLRYNYYHSGQIGFGDGTLNEIELYSTLEAAEKRIKYLLNKRFVGFEMADHNSIHQEDWGIMYYAEDTKKRGYYVQFTICFEVVHDKSLAY